VHSPAAAFHYLLEIDRPKAELSVGLKLRSDCNARLERRG
jgi:hypothetical protein